MLFWLLLATGGSLIAFYDYYLDLAHLLSNWNNLMSQGSYPFVMLLFALLWILLIKTPTTRWLKNEDTDLHLTRASLIGFLIAASALTLKLLTPTMPTPAQIVLILAYFQGLLMIALPRTGTQTLPLLALYAPTALLPTITDLYLDDPVAGFFILTLIPLTHAIGLQTQPIPLGISLLTKSGETIGLGINAACGGIASYAIFLFLNGLMIRDLKPPRRRAITYTLAGLGALVLLNILRLLIITAVAYGDVTQIQLVHNTLGYALFIAFYLIYAILLIRTK